MEVIVIDGNKIFAVNEVQVDIFEKKFCAFKVSVFDTIKLVLYESLHCHGVLSLKYNKGQSYIIEKNYCFNDVWSFF
jgi:sporulation protein YlmC with PRC-barrel domain